MTPDQFQILTTKLTTMLGARPLLVLEYGSTVRGYSRFDSDRDLMVIYKDLPSISILSSPNIIRPPVFELNGGVHDTYFVELGEFLRRIAGLDLHFMLAMQGRVLGGTDSAKQMLDLTRHAALTIGRRDYCMRMVSAIQGLLRSGNNKNHRMAVYTLAILHQTLNQREKYILPDIRVALEAVPALQPYIVNLVHGVAKGADCRTLTADEIAAIEAWFLVMEPRARALPETNVKVTAGPYLLEQRKGDETALSRQLNSVLERSNM